MPLGRVSGRVTVKGQAAAGGRIYFVPQRGPSAAGLIDANGRYALSTFGDGDGAVVGRHTVYFGPPPPPRPTKTAERVALPPPVIRAQTFPPPKYGAAETSGLTAEVRAGSNTCDFDLEDAKAGH